MHISCTSNRNQSSLFDSRLLKGLSFNIDIGYWIKSRLWIHDCSRNTLVINGLLDRGPNNEPPILYLINTYWPPCGPLTYNEIDVCNNITQYLYQLNT